MYESLMSLFSEVNVFIFESFVFYFNILFGFLVFFFSVFRFKIFNDSKYIFVNLVS